MIRCRVFLNDGERFRRSVGLVSCATLARDVIFEVGRTLHHVVSELHKCAVLGVVVHRDLSKLFFGEIRWICG